MKNLKSGTLLFFSLIFITLGCNNDDGPQSSDTTDKPSGNLEDYIPIIQSEHNVSFRVGMLVSPDEEAVGQELFMTRVDLYDDNFEILEDSVRTISYSIYDKKDKLILENEISNPESKVVELWDLKINDEPFYGDFSYNIKASFDIGEIIIDGRSFSVSCELIRGCCRDEISNCDFLENDEWIWNSQNVYSISFGGAEIISNCCN